jgi:hypothetical protein
MAAGAVTGRVAVLGVGNVIFVRGLRVEVFPVMNAGTS